MATKKTEVEKKLNRMKVSQVTEIEIEGIYADQDDEEFGQRGDGTSLYITVKPLRVELSYGGNDHIAISRKDFDAFVKAYKEMK